jgi:hypothetical protein
MSDPYCSSCHELLGTSFIKLKTRNVCFDCGLDIAEKGQSK